MSESDSTMHTEDIDLRERRRVRDRRGEHVQERWRQRSQEHPARTLNQTPSARPRPRKGAPSLRLRQVAVRRTAAVEAAWKRQIAADGDNGTPGLPPITSRCGRSETDDSRPQQPAHPLQAGGRRFDPGWLHSQPSCRPGRLRGLACSPSARHCESCRAGFGCRAYQAAVPAAWTANASSFAAE